MAPSTKYTEEYQQALSAYMNGGYEEAAAISDRLVKSYPDDPNLRLLRGHIHCYQNQYETAREQYQIVLSLTSDPELIDCANTSLDNASQYMAEPSVAPIAAERLSECNPDKPEDITAFQGGETSFNLTGSRGADLEQFTYIQTDNLTEDATPFADPFTQNPVNPPSPMIDPKATASEDPFFNQETPVERNSSFSLEDLDEEATLLMHGGPSINGAPADAAELRNQIDSNAPEDQRSAAEDESLFDDYSTPEPASAEPSLADLSLETQNLWLSEDAPSEESLFGDYFSSASTPSAGVPAPEAENFDVEEMELLDEADDLTLFMGGQSTASSLGAERGTVSPLEQDTFQDQNVGLGSSKTFGLNNTNFGFAGDLGDPEDLDDDLDMGTELSGYVPSPRQEPPEPVALLDDISGSLAGVPSLISDDRRESSSTAAPLATLPSAELASPPAAVVQPFSLAKSNLVSAIATGAISAIVAGAVSLAVAQPRSNQGALLAALGAGLAGGGTTFVMGQKNLAHIKRCTNDLQNQFGAVARGDLTAKATEYSQDEFGQLASGFNKMTRVIYAVTSESQQKAEENEKSKEDLQRQVIRLLDDVEGAARGDLTVQAEVTADVLGAVADSFNLTITNLQKIVQQVKVAARQVNSGAAENEIFARNLSSDALRQAEELAVTLNSVQMMTNAIQRVAESAKEANEVARSASAIALKGGDAVEQTVKGILAIRETVAETTRKVKRLAESSQEISKIVGLISQIASRTNLLALNASIEAARAGESGRGFAIVADEVRQLADRAAKSSKEIEQIVLQIQSETGSVMTAMEEGTQQVIEGTKLAEQAKRSLEDIIQVSSQIDTLVRSITTATVEQTETARSMAQVMQSVELTAQSTSQEAQRVSDSLQNLVTVARDLQGSVEKFKVDGAEA
ncbi:MAG: HAMP domain-containing protein [Aphanocapsa sp. GSE-SYN-MK-11-07L]|jgi:twitching motility protein PilJ|nr:HAMP domain-containing protein [Aphanocapsa sp. GSE-SYN-MK-11-07L]